MKFMALTCIDPALTRSMGDRMSEAQFALNRGMKGSGVMVAGRVIHPSGLKLDNANHPLRYLGNGTNLLAVGVLFAALARLSLGF